MKETNGRTVFAENIGQEENGTNDQQRTKAEARSWVRKILRRMYCRKETNRRQRSNDDDKILRQLRVKIKT